MTKYRLVKTNSNKNRKPFYYSIQKKTIFGWKEIDWEYNEDFALSTFNKYTLAPILEVIIEKEV